MCNVFLLCFFANKRVHILFTSIIFTISKKFQTINVLVPAGSNTNSGVVSSDRKVIVIII